MKVTTIVDENREEEIVIYVRQRRGIVDRIEEIVALDGVELMGYSEGGAVRLKTDDIYSVFVEDGKVFVTTDSGRLQLKCRLFEAEELLGGDFVRINQSCLVSLGKIARFDVSVGGALMVTMKNGYRDYVSRRQLRAVKERIGLRI